MSARGSVFRTEQEGQFNRNPVVLDASYYNGGRLAPESVREPRTVLVGKLRHWGFEAFSKCYLSLLPVQHQLGDTNRCWRR